MTTDELKGLVCDSEVSQAQKEMLFHMYVRNGRVQKSNEELANMELCRRISTNATRVLKKEYGDTKPDCSDIVAEGRSAYDEIVEDFNRRADELAFAHGLGAVWDRLSWGDSAEDVKQKLRIIIADSATKNQIRSAIKRGDKHILGLSARAVAVGSDLYDVQAWFRLPPKGRSMEGLIKISLSATTPSGGRRLFDQYLRAYQMRYGDPALGSEGGQTEASWEDGETRIQLTLSDEKFVASFRQL